MGCGGSKATKTTKEEIAVDDGQTGKTLLTAESQKGAEAEKNVIGQKAVVKVSIVSARGLRNADCILADKSDPYCTCEVIGKSETKIETAVVPDKLNPEWNFESEMNGYCVGDSLTFTVKDKDPIKPDDFLGKVVLKTDQFFASGFEGELPLTEAGDGVEAFLKIKAIVIQPKVRVTVFHARDLRNADWVGKSDPYVICEVVGKPDSKFETAAIAESLCPRWDYEAEVPGYQIGDSLTFTVKDKDPAKPDDILGKVSLQCDSFLESGFEGQLQLTETGAGVTSFLSVQVEIGEKKEPPVDGETNAAGEANVLQAAEEASPEKAPVDITVETLAQPGKTWCC